mmetsp:Transcript_70579/g.132070  ORF Transcript_70579/g.132070 Transcript_70579/m.132070 type:complete len:183 (+) Transcript_70579:91-639(+)
MPEANFSKRSDVDVVNTTRLTPRALYHTQTSIGGCWLDTAGHLLPCDDKHAPVKHYRTFGEWFERGEKPHVREASFNKKASRFWPYGEGVTKVYGSTELEKHRYKLDHRMVQGARPFAPPNAGSLPDLRHYRALPASEGRRQPDHIDLHYHRTFGDSRTADATWRELVQSQRHGFSGRRRLP